MTSQIDPNLWKGKATDIAYKDPYSETTHKLRNRVLLLSTVILLNCVFPLDLSKSQMLGIHFIDGGAPPLGGILALLLLYYSIRLAIYTVQEIESWLAQAQSLDFSGSRRSLHDIYAHHQSITNAIDSIKDQMNLHTDASLGLSNTLSTREVVKFEDIESNLAEMAVTKQSLDNMIPYLEKSNEEFGKEVIKAKTSFKEAKTNHKIAMRAQIVKVGLLEITLPFGLAAFSLYLSYNGMIEVLKMAVIKIL